MAVGRTKIKRIHRSAKGVRSYEIRPSARKRMYAGTKTNELDSTCGVPDDVLAQRFIQAVRIEEQVKVIKGLPVSKYDKLAKKAYIEYPDGRKVYV